MRLDLKADGGRQQFRGESVYEHFNLANADEGTLLSRLKASVKNYESASESKQLIHVVLEILKLDISEYYIELFLRTIRDLEDELIYLRSFIQIKEVMDQPHLLVGVCKRLANLMDLEEAYLFTFHVYEELQYRLTHDPNQRPYYLELSFILIRLEYLLKDYKQARIRHRHLLCDRKGYATFETQLVYWTILLDAYDLLLKREDLQGIIQKLPISYISFIQAAQYLQKTEVKLDLVTKIEETQWDDIFLKTKAETFATYLKYLAGEMISQERMADLAAKYPDDIHTQLLCLLTENTNKNKWNNLLATHGDIEQVLSAYRFHHKPPKTKLDLSSVSLTFLGGGEKIGGTAILLEVHGQKLLLDAGMHLNEEDYLTNFSLLNEKAIRLDELDGVIISHTHMDHIGSLPYIKKVAPEVPIYMTKETHKLFPNLLKNTLKNQKKKFYSDFEILNVQMDTESYFYEETFEISTATSEPWRVTFFEAGHILGAAAIYIQYQGICILFTGDYSTEPQRNCGVLKIPDDLQVDILITESTYGYQPTKSSISRKMQENAFIQSLQKTLSRGGSMLVPAFAVGRAQEIISLIKEAYSDHEILPFNIILDGNVVNVCAQYDESLQLQERLLDNVMIASDYYSDDSMTFGQFINLYVENGGACIIASSGMLQQGSSSYRYALNMIENDKNTIAFTGYLDSKSPAMALYHNRYQKGQRLLLGDVYVQMEASVESYRFSAHVSREDILKTILKLNPQKVFFMHGEHQKKYEPFVSEDGVGREIYPPIDLLLDWLKIPYALAINGSTY